MSASSENLLTAVKLGLDETATIKLVGDGVTVNTHCMYPSNGLVRVVVRGGADTLVASDEGGAVGEALSAGIAVRDYARTLSALVKDNGLKLSEGVIHTPRMPIAAAPLAIMLVANASQEVARWLYDHTKIKRTRDFRVMLSEFLMKRFDAWVEPTAYLVGHTTKRHKFANVISFPDRRRLIIDPVVHDSSSISTRVLAHLDIHALNDPLLVQRIVYDDEEPWVAADLNMLGMGATPIPFSKSMEVIERLAA
jgi:hypothetical protein